LITSKRPLPTVHGGQKLSLQKRWPGQEMPSDWEDNKMADKLVTIARFMDYMEAELARQKLEDFGIKAVVTGQNASNIYPGISAIAGPELQVFESVSEEAAKILESDERQ